MSSIAPPAWVRALEHEHGGNNPRLIMTKSLTSSDLDLQHQNRLLIPSQYVEVNLIPILSEAEKTAASLLQPPARRNIPNTGRVQGRKHGGLQVRVYSRSGFCCHLMLTCWESTGSTVIKGTEYKYLLNRSFFKQNDEVELWSFRQGEERKLCFALGKKI